jgi:cyclase
VGDPRNAARIFSEKEVDELFLLDIGASRDRRSPDVSLIRDIASEAFMPVCYGGGVRTVEHARELLRAGVEKIAVNSAAMERPAFVSELAREFGSQCVVGSIDVDTINGTPQVRCTTHAPPPTRDPVVWAQRLEELGAGELLFQSVRYEGELGAIDERLLTAIRGKLSKPVLYGGGLGSIESMLRARELGGLSGVSVGTRFVHFGPRRAVLITYLEEEERARLTRSSPPAM